jgi:hypothetical protein
MTTNSTGYNQKNIMRKSIDFKNIFSFQYHHSLFALIHNSSVSKSDFTNQSALPIFMLLKKFITRDFKRVLLIVIFNGHCGVTVNFIIIFKWLNF